MRYSKEINKSKLTLNCVTICTFQTLTAFRMKSGQCVSESWNISEEKRQRRIGFNQGNLPVTSFQGKVS